MILPEWTITDLNEKMESGELTSRQVTELYLLRIAAVDKSGPYINSVIELNPDALDIADGLDKEHKAGKLRGAQLFTPETFDFKQHHAALFAHGT